MDVLDIAQSWLGEGRKLAIATVIETWGSAPQPVGSQLVVDADGNFEGAVSGGCVEGAVITEAQDLIAVGGHKILNFGVADETAWQVGLACGGKIRVLVETVN
jgi:xanthine/CO dehydrogenase XdhC/CoxF family maturation factor